MKKYIKTALQSFFMFALVLFCTMQMEMNVQAEYVEDKVNGVNYDDESMVSVGYASEYNYGGGACASIYLQNDGDRVTNIKSSSKNLIAKKTRESYSSKTRKNKQTGKATTEVDYGNTYISFFAKKAGTYKVTFDVVKPDGTVRCTKTITVKTNSYEAATSPIKSIKYAGKDLYSYYPYTTKTSGKLKVTLKKGYKLVSIKIGKYDSNGKMVYTKVKNNGKITLAKKTVYKSEYKYSDGTMVYTTDMLFPATSIVITYKNKKTGESAEFTNTLYTMNKKQSW